MTGMPYMKRSLLFHSTLSLFKKRLTIKDQESKVLISLTHFWYADTTVANARGRCNSCKIAQLPDVITRCAHKL